MAYKKSDIPPELRRSQDIMSGELLSGGAKYNEKGEMQVTDRQETQVRAEMYANKIKTAIETVLKENQITAADLVIALRGNTSEKTAKEYQFGGTNHHPEMKDRPGEVARLNLIDFINKYFNTRS